jgi:hypothetical protein
MMSAASRSSFMKIAAQRQTMAAHCMQLLNRMIWLSHGSARPWGAPRRIELAARTKIVQGGPKLRGLAQRSD